MHRQDVTTSRYFTGVFFNKKILLILKQELATTEKHQSFIILLATIHCGKLVQPSEPILRTLTFLMWALRWQIRLASK